MVKFVFIKHWIFLILIALSLTSCMGIVSADAKLNLQGNESWSLEMELTLPGLENQLLNAQLKPGLDQWVNQAKAKQIEAAWEQKPANQDGNSPYVIKFSGQGYQKLNSLLNSQAIQLNNTDSSKKDDKTIKVSLNSQTLVPAGTLRSSFTLNGGEIISTNGQKVNANTVRWDSPTETMEALMQEPSGINWLAIGLIILGIAILTVAIIVLIRILARSRSMSSLPIPNIQPRQTYPQYHPPVPQQPVHLPPAQVKPTRSIDPSPLSVAQSRQAISLPDHQTKFCHGCGSQIPLIATFCTSCGVHIDA